MVYLGCIPTPWVYTIIIFYNTNPGPTNHLAFTSQEQRYFYNVARLVYLEYDDKLITNNSFSLFFLTELMLPVVLKEEHINIQMMLNVWYESLPLYHSVTHGLTLSMGIVYSYLELQQCTQKSLLGVSVLLFFMFLLRGMRLGVFFGSNTH